MAIVSRVSDIWVGICCCHSDPTCIPMSGRIIVGSPNQGSSSLKTARMTDIVISNCCHPGFVVTGSSKNKSNGIAKATVGSIVTGCVIGIVITGNPTHNTGL